MTPSDGVLGKIVARRCHKTLEAQLLVLEGVAASAGRPTEQGLTVLRTLGPLLEDHVLRKDGTRLEELELVLLEVWRLYLLYGWPGGLLAFVAILE